MTPEQINIAIAEALGIDTSLADVCQCGDPIKKGWGHEGHCATPMLFIDNYHGDLNAMHEAKMTLTPKQRVEYQVNLCIAQGHPCESDPHWRQGDCARRGLFATAAEEAQAFLRTVGKWEQ